VIGTLSLFLTLFVAAPLLAQAQGDLRKGQELYLEKCVLCHGAQGQGWDWSKKAEPPLPVPDLVATVPSHPDQYLFDIVKGGGEAVGKTRFMPPFGFQLSDQDVRDIVAFLRTLSKPTK
jgi:cytochrome c oxidase cbb3-type subunit 3